MNLSRAKTVLIYTFLLLNVFLCYQLWQDQGYGGFAAFGRKEEISRLEGELQKAGLLLETDLPKTIGPMAYLVVEPWHYSPAEVNASFWEILEGKGEPRPEVAIHLGAGDEEKEENNLAGYFFGRYELIPSKTGVATLKYMLQENEKDELIAREKIAWQLVNNLTIFEDFVPDYSCSTGEGKIVLFRQEYEGFPLFAGYLHYSSLERQRIVQFYRLEVLGFAGQEREIVPPSTALLRFLEVYNGTEAGACIIEFSLGYYTREYDAERWEIPPVWRIRLNNGELYYINAFTGNVEI